MSEIIQRPLPEWAEQQASAHRQKLADLEAKFREAAQPYLDELVRLEAHRPPPIMLLTQEEAAALLPVGALEA